MKLNSVNKKMIELIIIIVLMVLIFLTALAMLEVRDEIDASVTDGIVVNLLTQNAAFSRELETVLRELTAYSSLWTEGPLESNQNVLFYTDRMEMVLDVGIIGIDNEKIMGNIEDISTYSAVALAAEGVENMAYVADYLGEEAVMFAVPIYVEGSLDYVLYEVKTKEQMAWLNRDLQENQIEIDGKNAEGKAISLLLNEGGYFIFPPQEGVEETEHVLYVENQVDWGKELIPIKQGLKGDVKIHMDKLVISGKEYTLTASYFLETEYISVRLTPPGSDGRNMTSMLDQCVIAFFAFLASFFVMVYRMKKHDIESQREMYKVAYRDDLTGLYNWDWLQKEMSLLGDSVKNKMLVLVDIKEFKQVNQLYGREAGDFVLKEVARSLMNQSWVDLTVRKEGDRFILLLPQRDFAELHSKLIYIFRSLRKIQWNEKMQNDSLSLYFRCGVVDITKNIREITCHQLVDECLLALKSGKIPKKTEIIHYNAAMRKAHEKNQVLRDRFKEAMAEGEFEVFLQAKYHIEQDTLAGAEALIRWNYEKKNYISPGGFIPLFEQDGTVKEIDRFVFRTVVEKFAQWKKDGLPLLPISVNLSRVQMDNENIVMELSHIAEQFEVDKKLIQIEITESADFQDLDLLLHTMNEIVTAGFSLAMDDFGTGYSSFSMLQDMPLEVLKIDKSFVDKINDPRGRHIVSDIISMAKHLGIACLAEGVEEKYQNDLLKAFGCDYVQGYFYAKPEPMESYEALLRKNLHLKELL